MTRIELRKHIICCKNLKEMNSVQDILSYLGERTLFLNCHESKVFNINCEYDFWGITKEPATLTFRDFIAEFGDQTPLDY